MDGGGLELMDIGEQDFMLLFLDIDLGFFTETGATGAGFTNVALRILSRSVAAFGLELMTAAEPRTIVLTRLLWRTCPLPEDPGRHSSRPTDEDCIFLHHFKIMESGNHLRILENVVVDLNLVLLDIVCLKEHEMIQ